MRHFKFSILILTVISLVISCKEKPSESSAESNNSFKNNFENALGWNYNSKVLRVNGHSGSFVTYVDTVQVYSHAFISKLNEMTELLPKKITAKAWVLRKTENAGGQFVAEIANETTGISWVGVKLKEAVPQLNVWTEIKIEIPLDSGEVQNINNTLKVYGWLDTSKEPVYFDDFEIVLE